MFAVRSYVHLGPGVRHFSLGGAGDPIYSTGLPYNYFYFIPTKMAAVHELKYSLQKASRDMVAIAVKTINVQVAPIFNANRNYAEKIGQQHSHFRIIIRKCWIATKRSL